MTRWVGTGIAVLVCASFLVSAREFFMWLTTHQRARSLPLQDAAARAELASKWRLATTVLGWVDWGKGEVQVYSRQLK